MSKFTSYQATLSGRIIYSEKSACPLTFFLLSRVVLILWAGGNYLLEVVDNHGFSLIDWLVKCLNFRIPKMALCESVCHLRGYMATVEWKENFLLLLICTCLWFLFSSMFSLLSF